MGQIGGEGFGNVHPHISGVQPELRYVVGADGAKLLGDRALDGIGIPEEVRNELLEGEFTHGVKFGEDLDQFSTDPEVLAMHITNEDMDRAMLNDLGRRRPGEELLFEPPANEGYGGYL